MQKSINSKVIGTKNGRTMICDVCGSKKSRFIKKQEAEGLLSNLGIRTPLSKIPLLGNVLFRMQLYEMNDIINKFLLAGDKFMPKMHLRNATMLVGYSQQTKKESKRNRRFKIYLQK